MDDETKLTLHGLQQVRTHSCTASTLINRVGFFDSRISHECNIRAGASLSQFFIKLSEEEKNRKLNDLLDVLEFNQVCMLLDPWMCGHSSDATLGREANSYSLPLTISHCLPRMTSTSQVVIFVSKVNRAVALNKLLVDCNFPSICIHGAMNQEER